MDPAFLKTTVSEPGVLSLSSPFMTKCHKTDDADSELPPWKVMLEAPTCGSCRWTVTAASAAPA